MAGAADDITGNESFDELVQKVDKGLAQGDRKFGSKINIDPKLNFELEEDTEYVRATMTAYKNGEIIPFLIEKSDELAAETGDTKNSTYSRMASSIASIIKKYVGVAPRWNDLVGQAEKKYEPILERFMGTHQTMQECFLAKVIDKVKGTEIRDQFLALLDGKGFDYAEGFEAEIITKDDSSEPLVRIIYKKASPDPDAFVFDEIVPISLIEDIVQMK